MCIIACKPIGLEMPDHDTIENMWHANSDGAGIMYNHKGHVHIEKGFMKLDDFLAALKRIGKDVDLKQAGVVMHFRITTHGGTRPENCHPFPISDSIPMLKKLRLTTRIGVAHNGIIHNTPRDKTISDTMEYIAAQLAPLYRAMPEFYRNQDAMLLVKNGIESKMAFLTDTGDIYTVGDFVEDKGILYSNHSYEGYWSTPRWMSYGVWDAATGKWNYSSYTPTYTCSSGYKDYRTDDLKYLPGDTVDDDDDTAAPLYDDLIEEHYFLPLTNVDGAYYVDMNGEMIEDNNYKIYLDAHGDVWYLDDEMGLLFRADFVVGVYDKNGMALRYSPDMAEYMPCYDYWEEETRK